MSMGAKGVISVASNIIPDEIAQLCSLCGGGNYKAAWEIFRKYRRLMELMFIDVNPIPVKTAMKLMDMDKGRLRLPLTDIEVTKENLEEISLAIFESIIIISFLKIALKTFSSSYCSKVSILVISTPLPWV